MRKKDRKTQFEKFRHTLVLFLILNLWVVSLSCVKNWVFFVCILFYFKKTEKGGDQTLLFSLDSYICERDFIPVSCLLLFPLKKAQRFYWLQRKEESPRASCKRGERWRWFITSLEGAPIRTPWKFWRQISSMQMLCNFFSTFNLCFIFLGALWNSWTFRKKNYLL